MIQLDNAFLIGSLDAFPARLAALVHGLDETARRWQPSPRDWSVHTVVCHLLDEERRDFRPRLERTLREPQEAWEPIDPEGWVELHGYATWGFEETLSCVIDERRANVAWLRGLGQVEWTRSMAHPRLGELRAGDLLLSWTQHDLLHVRQIVKRVHGYCAAAAAGFAGTYAGAW